MQNVTFPRLLLLLLSPVKDSNFQRKPKGIWYPHFKLVRDARVLSLKEQCSLTELPNISEQNQYYCAK